VGSNDDGSRGENLQLGYDSPISHEINHVEILEILFKRTSDLAVEEIGGDEGGEDRVF